MKGPTDLDSVLGGLGWDIFGGRLSYCLLTGDVACILSTEIEVLWDIYRLAWAIWDMVVHSHSGGLQVGHEAKKV